MLCFRRCFAFGFDFRLTLVAALDCGRASGDVAPGPEATDDTDVVVSILTIAPSAAVASSGADNTNAVATAATRTTRRRIPPRLNIQPLSPNVTVCHEDSARASVEPCRYQRHVTNLMLRDRQASGKRSANHLNNPSANDSASTSSTASAISSILRLRRVPDTGDRLCVQTPVAPERYTGSIRRQLHGEGGTVHRSPLSGGRMVSMGRGLVTWGVP